MVPETNGVIDLSLAAVFSFTMTVVSLKHLVSFTHHPTLKIKHNSEAESAEENTTSHREEPD